MDMYVKRQKLTNGLGRKIWENPIRFLGRLGNGNKALNNFDFYSFLFHFDSLSLSPISIFSFNFYCFSNLFLTI